MASGKGTTYLFLENMKCKETVKDFIESEEGYEIMSLDEMSEWLKGTRRFTKLWYSLRW